MRVCFDLDGTLTDSFPGISRCINYALAELGRNPVPDTQLRRFVGRPLATIFGELLEARDTELLDRAVAAYRVRFDGVGIFENSLYPGVARALGRFQEWGHSLRIVTAKPRLTAQRVASHFDIERYFEAIHGPELAERACSKADLLRTALEGGDGVSSVMIGDRVDDIAAARANGVRAVAVAWGYGDRGELKAANPDFVAETVGELTAWVHAAG